MGKLLFLLLIVALFFVVRAWIRSRDRETAARRHDSARSAERMVNCNHCGLYLPESEALRDRGEHYCCEQHRRLGGR